MPSLDHNTFLSNCICTRSPPGLMLLPTKRVPTLATETPSTDLPINTLFVSEPQHPYAWESQATHTLIGHIPHPSRRKDFHSRLGNWPPPDIPITYCPDRPPDETNRTKRCRQRPRRGNVPHGHDWLLNRWGLAVLTRDGDGEFYASLLPVLFSALLVKDRPWPLEGGVAAGPGTRQYAVQLPSHTPSPMAARKSASWAIQDGNACQGLRENACS